LRHALASGRVQALRSAVLDAEFADVLCRSQFGLDETTRERAMARWTACSEPIGGVVPAPLQCADPDDQKFLDAAFSARADVLLTRDKLLLQLAPRAAAAGLSICKPAALFGTGSAEDRRADDLTPCD
jgi:predicted nucleic acid-binding protein